MAQKKLNILLIGYGKMGKAIHDVLLKRGHTLCGKIDIDNINELSAYNSTNVDVAIEFSHPSSAFDNVWYCLTHQIPIVCGTTGWLDNMPKIIDYCSKNKSSICYSGNYSIGVNIMFALNEYLAKLMNTHSEYDATMHETHHVYKKDAPSGTAITLAEGILKNNTNKSKWTINRDQLKPDTLFIGHDRIHNEPGIHTVKYTSPIDSIEIKHTAFNREGFATGAVLAAEYIYDKKSTQIYTMYDILNLQKA
ncbi:MAG: 4-hydroxy-tetrahydrodipicolinate reductase [Cytophagales bacterium]|nr:4-hydroxy-tetrahydrodipicolinate reductase [Cytophagales bacterium]